jgi:uncharacterized protein (DUF849 family)
MTCTARTKGGRPCRRAALGGREVCHAHSGQKVGRPSALTPEVRERLVAAKKAGCPDWVAAQSAGISTTTYYGLLKRGESEGSGPASELLEAIRRAEAEGYLHAMVSWRREMAGNWRAGVAYIDRVDRGRFRSSPGSSPGRPPLSGEGRLDLSELSAEELEILERRYEGERCEGEEE